MPSIRPRRAYPNLKAFLAGTQTTHAFLAEHVGVSRVVITNIANGRRRPRLRLALKIADLANIPVESLLNEGANQ